MGVEGIARHQGTNVTHYRVDGTGFFEVFLGDAAEIALDAESGVRNVKLYLRASPVRAVSFAVRRLQMRSHGVLLPTAALVFVLAMDGVSGQGNKCPFPSDGVGPFTGRTGFKLQHAQNFDLQVTPYSAIITIATEKKSIILEACSYTGVVTPGAITVPVATVAVANADTVLPFLEQLGQLSSVVSLVPSTLASTSCSLGAKIANTSTAAGVVPTLFGQGGYDIAGLIASEKSPLAMAEWYYFFDAFFAFQGKSEDIMKAFMAQYACIKQQVVAYTNSVAGTSSALPNVVISATDLAQNKIVAPSNMDFWRTLLTDAGAFPNFASDANTWIQMVKKADVVFDITNDNGIMYGVQKWENVYNLTMVTPGYPFLKGGSGQVWRIDKRQANGQNDFFQSYASQPTVVLMDMITTFSSTFNPAFNHYFLRNLANDPEFNQLSAGQCPNISKPILPLNGQFCDPNTNKYNPTVGRFSSLNPSGPGTTNGDGAAVVGWSAGAIAGIVFIVLLVLGTCYMGILLALRRRGRYPGAGSTSGGSAGVGLSSLREAVQKRRWFKMHEDGDDILLRDVGGAEAARSAAAPRADTGRGPSWQMEHGMPVFPSEE